jgi:hypothetical protein
MLDNTRRRALGLLIGAAASMRLLPVMPQAFAKTADCFALQPFGDWKGVATNTQAGAKIGQIEFSDPDTCDLRGSIQVAASLDAKLVLFGDPDGTPLPKTFLVKPENRLIVRNDDGSTVIDEALCGVCTDIRDDKVSIVLPLATAPLFRESRAVEIVIKLGEAKDCAFTINCEDLRKALDWAREKKDALARSFDAKECTPPPQGCFMTTACCGILGLGDDCFELTALRRYRDRVLVARPDGGAAVAAYYAIAPTVLARLAATDPSPRLMSTYARFILPSAIAARLGLNRLAYRLYRRMMRELTHEFAPELLPLLGPPTRP